MKKKYAVSSFVLIVSMFLLFAQETIELEEGKYFEFPNPVYKPNKRLYRDNIRFINDTLDNIEFEAYGKPVNSTEVEFLFYKLVKAEDSNVCNAYLPIKCYETVYIKILNGVAEHFQVERSHNDLYFTVRKFIPASMNTKFSYSFKIKSNKAFINSKIWATERIPRLEIKVEDKEFGIFSRRGKDIFSFSFKIQTTDEGVSVDFYDFYDPAIHVVGKSMQSYNAQKSYSEILARNLETYLNDNQ